MFVNRMLITFFGLLITSFLKKLSKLIRIFTVVFNIKNDAVDIFFINKIGY